MAGKWELWITVFYFSLDLFFPLSLLGTDLYDLPSNATGPTLHSCLRQNLQLKSAGGLLELGIPAWAPHPGGSKREMCAFESTDGKPWVV